jgi:large repetitive protein
MDRYLLVLVLIARRTACLRARLSTATVAQSLTTLCLVFAAGCGVACAADPVEGFGAQTPGGAGGRALVVTNLNDAGPGSLREAVETKGPRTITFRVAGVIHLAKALAIREPFVTIDASTAPSTGITLIDDSVFIRTHDVIIRYLRSHAGDKGKGKMPDVHGFSLAEASNIVLDHCSAYWAIDEDIGMWNCHDVTVQWCILAEGLFHSKHEKGPHSMGILMGGELNDHMSFHHNLLASDNQRNPRVQAGVADVRNNLIYNWGGHGAYYTGKTRVNMIGNVYIPGPDTAKTRKTIQVSPDVTLYLKDNELREAPDRVVRDWEMVYPAKEGTAQRVKAEFATPVVTTLRLSEVYEAVLAKAGAILPVRDAEDERIVQGVRKRTGRIIDYPGQVR